MLLRLSKSPACVYVQSRFGLVPLVSLINKYEGKPLYSVAGAAVALAGRNDLQTLQDIKNQRVSACIIDPFLGCHSLRSLHVYTSALS